MIELEKMRRWTSECDAGLCYALNGDRDEIAAGVDSGALECYRLWGGDAYMVTRMEPGELTVCCYQGKRLVEAVQWLIPQAKSRNVQRIRFHTKRPALARMLRQFNPEHLEHVYAVDVRGMH